MGGEILAWGCICSNRSLFLTFIKYHRALLGPLGHRRAKGALEQIQELRIQEPSRAYHYLSLALSKHHLVFPWATREMRLHWLAEDPA